MGFGNPKMGSGPQKWGFGPPKWGLEGQKSPKMAKNDRNLPKMDKIWDKADQVGVGQAKNSPFWGFYRAKTAKTGLWNPENPPTNGGGFEF